MPGMVRGTMRGVEPRHRTRASKLLSKLLRHQPELGGLELSRGGWVDVEDVLRACAALGLPLSRAELDEVVATNAKRRFTFDDTGRRMRAAQGHSVEIDLELPEAEPPAVLYHGTSAAKLPTILAEGLRAMGRHHVHLSVDADTARVVGARRGRPAVLVIDAAAMHAAGHVFYVSDNGVWLVASVPPRFIHRP